jgi:hypothetical protein
MIRCLRVARTTALRARTQTINALKGLLVTAPAELREQLRGRSATRLVAAAADASALWRSLTSAAGVPSGTVTSNSTRNSIGFSSCPCLRLGGDAASYPRKKLNSGLAGGRLRRSGAVRISSYFRTL